VGRDAKKDGDNVAPGPAPRARKTREKERTKKTRPRERGRSARIATLPDKKRKEIG